ncbi:unnamed protein product [Camellia sinensis]
MVTRRSSQSGWGFNFRRQLRAWEEDELARFITVLGNGPVLRSDSVDCLGWKSSQSAWREDAQTCIFCQQDNESIDRYRRRHRISKTFKMVRSDENHPGVIRPANIQGGLHPRVGKLAAGMGHYQRALSTINRNIVGAHPYPGAVNKRPALSEKFAAKMAGKQKQPLLEETKKVVQSLPVPTASRDCSIIDVDDYKIAGDSRPNVCAAH